MSPQHLSKSKNIGNYRPWNPAALPAVGQAAIAACLVLCGAIQAWSSDEAVNQPVYVTDDGHITNEAEIIHTDDSIVPEIAPRVEDIDREEEQELDLGEYNYLYRQIQIARRGMNLEEAESMYFDLLTRLSKSDNKRIIILEMVDFYRENDSRIKLSYLMDNYLQLYPQDDNAPHMYYELGLIYREMGDYDKAQKNFYNVLHAAMSINPQEIDEYRKLSLQAEREIAETYFEMGDYKNALKFYARLNALDLGRRLRREVRFKIAYANYLQQDYAAVISMLQRELTEFPEERLYPQGYYILANSLSKMGRYDESMAQVIALLKSVSAQRDFSEKEWLYWKERTGTQMANSFFEKGDYMSALKIYQTMAPISDEAAWRLPIVYQLGLCFEKLHINSKAWEAFVYVTDYKKPENDLEEENSTLVFLRESAAWRLKHIKWKDENKEEREEIISKVSMKE